MSEDIKQDAMVVYVKTARDHLEEMAADLYNQSVDAHNSGMTLAMASARMRQAATIFSDAGCEKFLDRVLREGEYVGGAPTNAPGGSA
jgi:hypothetical protein